MHGVIAEAFDDSHREGAETISDDMNAAHWHGYREGAEAMREECAIKALEQRCEQTFVHDGVTAHKAGERAPWDLACTTIADELRALPIPEWDEQGDSVKEPWLDAARAALVAAARARVGE